MRSASIVIPTFNRAALLKRAIDSALAQTYPCEVIVCDHGSIDTTQDLVESYGNQVRYIRRIEDRGPIACWRDGIEHSSGELLHITFDDDWIEPEFMARCVSLLNDDVGFVYTQYVVHDLMNGSTALSSKDPDGIRPMRDIVRYLLRSPLTISPGCALFRRNDALKNLLLEVPGAEGRYGKNSGVGEDLLLFLLTSIDYRYYAHVSEPMAHFMAHTRSITIDAISSERYAELCAAYTNAKAYYYRHSFSEQPRGRALQIADHIKWKIAARARLR